MESQNQKLAQLPEQQTKQASLQSLRLEFERFNQLSKSLCDSADEINQAADHFNPQVIPINGSQQQSLQNMSGLINAIPGAVLVLDPQGNITEANKMACSLLGDKILQRPWRDIVQDSFLAELDQGELQTEDGRQFSISTRPLGYAPGQVLLLSDVTETRKMQRVAHQNLHLMTMGKMMASLAHQIRTPLASSMLYMSQIVDGSLNPQTSYSFSEKALRRIKHIETIINDMLVFAHGGQFITTRFSAKELFSELTEQLQAQLQQRNAHLVINGANCGDHLQGNKDALLGAMANICVNSLQACRDKPEITINMSTNIHGVLAISIRDNGSGMEREVRDHIFDPFFSTKTDGTGLGLAVVKSVIESHQGKIAVFSKPGKGTRFRIFLPSRQTLQTQISDSDIRQAVASN